MFKKLALPDRKYATRRVDGDRAGTPADARMWHTDSQMAECSCTLCTMCSVLLGEELERRAWGV